MLYKHMSKSQTEEAIELLDDFHITNDLFREHLLDLCMNRKAREAFDNLPPATKTAFTRAYNKEHKDPTAGKKGKKTAAAAVQEEVSESDEEKDKELNLEEDEMAEIKRAKQRERERLKAKNE